ncbi:ADP-ribosylglycohydrolase family protein, partial [Candidatus Symbiopectobacterium sp. NZEC135]
VIGNHILNWALQFGAFEKNILGPSSKTALFALKQGADIDSLENNGITNGSAMRISPLGCLLPPMPLSDFIDAVALASSPTHKSDIAVAGATVIAWAVSQGIAEKSWSEIRTALPAVAQAAQEKRVTTYSPALSARLQLALDTVQNAPDDDTALEQIYQLIGTGTEIIQSVPAAIAMVELAHTEPNRCAILCANLGGDTDTIGAMATAICGAIHGVESIDSDFKRQLDEVNALDIDAYSSALARLRQRRMAV